MSLALPSKRQEDWRWTDLSAIDAALGAAPAANDAHPDHTRFLIENVTGSVIVFVDGRFVPSASTLDGVAVEAVSADAHGDRELWEHSLAKEALSHAPAGVVLRLDPGHASPGTVQVVHIATGGAAHLAHRYELGEDAQASVVETYVGAPASWTNVAASVALARSARLMRTVRRLGPGAHSETLAADVGQAASYRSTWLASGAAGARLESAVVLSGEGVSARVEVAREGQKTDAEQSIKALLLKRTATANAKPELEIYADDVKCAHGATVGELSRDALFYLQSRGVAPEEARALLTEAFIADALGTIGQEAVRDALTADAVAWLRGAQ